MLNQEGNIMCSSEKHQPNLIIWSRLVILWLVAEVFILERGCRYITHAKWKDVEIKSECSFG